MEQRARQGIDSGIWDNDRNGGTERGVYIGLARNKKKLVKTNRHSENQQLFPSDGA